MSGRRGFLALAAGAATAQALAHAPAARAAGHPDAELLALCAHLDALTAAFNATDFDAIPGTLAADIASAEQARLGRARILPQETLTGMVPATLDGHRARARSFALWNPESLSDTGGGQNARLQRAILRDLVRPNAQPKGKAPPEQRFF